MYKMCTYVTWFLLVCGCLSMYTFALSTGRASVSENYPIATTTIRPTEVSTKSR